MANRCRFVPMWIVVLLISIGCSISVVEAQQPPRNLSAIDRPNDDGTAIELQWEKSPDENAGLVQSYTILRAENKDGPFLPVGTVAAGIYTFSDEKKKSNGDSPESATGESEATSAAPAPFSRGKSYYYQVEALGMDQRTAASGIAGPVQAQAQWFHTGKAPTLVISILFFVLVVLFIELSRRGREMFVRPIAGMSEIDNAIGRATEMGRPILYVLGLGDPGDIATIASYTILARVAKKTAEYRTDLIVPCYEPIVMTIAQETVKSSYIEAGHPDAYSDHMVFYVTSMQFAYVAAVNGLILREKTATNCYFGKFYAESLLLSETGNLAGSIQVAGTDEVAQLPFFVTTCDYTLIGEELYAASAYLGRDPLLLGALKAQDWAKAIIMILILFGVALMTFDIHWLKDLITTEV